MSIHFLANMVDEKLDNSINFDDTKKALSELTEDALEMMEDYTVTDDDFNDEMKSTMDDESTVDTTPGEIIEHTTPMDVSDKSDLKKQEKTNPKKPERSTPPKKENKKVIKPPSRPKQDDNKRDVSEKPKRKSIHERLGRRPNDSKYHHGSNSSRGNTRSRIPTSNERRYTARSSLHLPRRAQDSRLSYRPPRNGYVDRLQRRPVYQENGQAKRLEIARSRSHGRSISSSGSSNRSYSRSPPESHCILRSVKPAIFNSDSHIHKNKKRRLVKALRELGYVVRLTPVANFN